LLNDVVQKEFGFKLIRSHEHYEALAKGVHRFRSTDQAGFFSLAKDIVRLTADSIDSSAIQKVVNVPKGEKWGSLRSLQALVALRDGREKARELVGPLVGAYELRLADAHLPSSEVEASLNLVGVKGNEPFVIQGCRLLHACVSSIYSIAEALRDSAKASGYGNIPRP
jgi:hypothetical protein